MGDTKVHNDIDCLRKIVEALESTSPEMRVAQLVFAISRVWGNAAGKFFDHRVGPQLRSLTSTADREGDGWKRKAAGKVAEVYPELMR